MATSWVLRWAKDAYTVSQIGDKLLISSVNVRRCQLAAAQLWCQFGARRCAAVYRGRADRLSLMACPAGTAQPGAQGRDEALPAWLSDSPLTVKLTGVHIAASC
jgi:hypothetical protein